MCVVSQKLLGMFLWAGQHVSVGALSSRPGKATRTFNQAVAEVRHDRGIDFSCTPCSFKKIVLSCLLCMFRLSLNKTSCMRLFSAVCTKKTTKTMLDGLETC